MNAAVVLESNSVSLNRKCDRAKRLSIRERNDLIIQHQGLVRKIAHQYARKCKEPFEDLVQEGNIGLVKAIERFESNRGAFSSLAVPFIRGAVLHYLRDRSHSVKVPRAWQELFQKVKKRENLKRESEVEIVRALGIDTDTWSNIKQAMQNRTLDLNEEICESVVGGATPENFALFQELFDAIQELEPTTIKCVEAVYFEQLSHRQASKKLRIPYKEVEANVNLAVRSLAKSFSELSRTGSPTMAVEEKFVKFVGEVRKVYSLLPADQ